ncbi:MAG: DEAD/DEAH box helicase [Candidatus Aenigmatarchaeota archaeon]
MNEKIISTLRKLGIEKLTKIQEMAYKPIYEGKDCLLISPSGTGKTLAALLPILEKWIEEKPKPISILYISPMKALNRDQEEHLSFWAKELEMNISVRHGDTSSYERKQQAEFPNDLLIVTLEALQSVLVGKKIRNQLKNVRWVILDEVHEIIESKRGIQLSLALERLRELSPDFQLIMLSATISEPEKVAKFFGKKDVEIISVKYEKPIEISVVFPRAEKVNEKLAERLFISTESLARLKFIIEKIKESKSSLIFTNTREFAEILTNRLKIVDKTLNVGVHHSSLSKNIRIETEKKFKEGKLKALVCTSSLQLGIDIGSVDLVIQYQSPREVTQFLQRIGRSGHKYWEVSKGIIIATDEDDILESGVIARKALNSELESLSIHTKSYDVLAHQIVGIAFDFGNSIEIEKAYQIVRRAFPYKDLKKEEFIRVVKFLEEIGIIFIRDGRIINRRKAYDYYFSQLSTIPDVKEYKVINIVDGTTIGSLDEDFVAVYGEEGSVFILKGDAYKIVSIEEDKVYVEECKEKDAAIPSWVGELVPVSFEVASEVGKLRKMIAENRITESELKEKYKLDENCLTALKSFYNQNKDFVPSDKEIIIEYFDNKIVIHSSFGNRVNETLSTIIINKINKPVKNKNDAYRIILAFQEKVDRILAERIKEIVEKINLNEIENEIGLFLSNSDLFLSRFLNVAKRFGVIEKNANISFFMVRKLCESFRNTPLYDETLKEIMVEKLDILSLKKILGEIKNGEIKISLSEGPSKLSQLALRKVFVDYFEEIKEDLIEKFKERILEKKIKLICLNCGNWKETYYLKNLPENISCKNCGAKLLAVVKEKDKKAEKIVKKYSLKGKLSSLEKEEFGKLIERASLFLSFGKRFAICIAVKGIGLENAKRILGKFYRNEDEFFEEVFNAYKNFLKTRKFWRI